MFKEKILKIVDKTVLFVNQKASGEASWYGLCQPQEPDNLKNRIQEMKKQEKA